MDWKRKLTSRKFYMALGLFITDAVVFLGGSAELAAQIVALIMSAGAVIAYIFSEGCVDAAMAKANAVIMPEFDADDELDDDDVDDGWG